MINPLFALMIGSLMISSLALLFFPKGGLVGYIQRSQRLTNQVLQEDALKQMHKCERHGNPTTIDSLAGALNISQSHATKLLSDIQSKDLVILTGERFSLTKKGNEYALRIIRAHRLLERYLAEETGYQESHWHDLAEQKEHSITVEEINALSSHLGYPSHDPHGDPIPTASLEFVVHGGEPLTNMEIDQPLQIVHLEDEPKEIYSQLIAEGFYPGMHIRILDKTAQRIIVWGNEDEHILAPIVAANVSVIPVSEKEMQKECRGTPLSALKPGQFGKVITISPRMRGVERRRMMDLGILPGTIIKTEMNSPGGDPTAYFIRDTLIALRNEQAAQICVETSKE